MKKIFLFKNTTTHPCPMDELALNPQMSLAESQGPSSEANLTLPYRACWGPVSRCNSRLADPLRAEPKLTTDLSWEESAWEPPVSTTICLLMFCLQEQKPGQCPTQTMAMNLPLLTRIQRGQHLHEAPRPSLPNLRRGGGGGDEAKTQLTLLCSPTDLYEHPLSASTGLGTGGRR